jgi:AcrR family transcriptional regulator
MRASRDASPAREDYKNTPIDGRTLRRSRNRDAVITALLDLIREGNLHPGAAEIAERAGVSHRSVFRYFDDLNDLVRTAIRQDFLAAEPLIEIPRLGEGTLEERVANLVDARLALYEYVRGTALVARMRAGSMPDIDAEIATVNMFYREQLRQHFETELDARSQDETESIIDAGLVLTSFDSFDLHQQTLGHDGDAIRASWTTSLFALLSG